MTLSNSHHTALPSLTGVNQCSCSSIGLVDIVGHGSAGSGIGAGFLCACLLTTVSVQLGSPGSCLVEFVEE